MDEEKEPPKAYALGDDISRHSIDELEALKARCLAEAERIQAEIEAKAATRAAADAFFR